MTPQTRGLAAFIFGTVSALIVANSVGGATGIFWGALVGGIPVFVVAGLLYWLSQFRD